MLHPLNPTIRPFAGNDLGHQPSASAATGAPKGKTQGIPKKLAAFSGAGGRQIGRANSNALAAKGDAGEDHGPGGVIGIGCDPDALGYRSLAVLKPICQGRDLGGDDVARGQQLLPVTLGLF